MSKKTCPVMSRPVVFESRVEVIAEMHWVQCDENCQWWDKERQDCKQVISRSRNESS